MAQPNGLNPEFNRISFTTAGRNGCPVIMSTAYTTASSILAEIGYLPNASIVLSSNGASGQIFVMQGSVYTPIAIP